MNVFMERANYIKINLQLYSIKIPTSVKLMNKVDQIRKKIEQNKQKLLLKKIQVNQNLSYSSFQPQNKLISHQLPNTLSIFPALSMAKSHQRSTNYSERSRELNTSNFGSNCFIAKERVKRQYHQIAQKRGLRYYFNQQVKELKTKSLNRPNAERTISRRKSLNTEDRSYCVINAQTNQTVIIVTETQPVRSRKQLFAKRIIKRPSLIENRQIQLPQKEVKSWRKQQISPWETSDNILI